MSRKSSSQPISTFVKAKEFKKQKQYIVSFSNQDNNNVSFQDLPFGADEDVATPSKTIKEIYENYKHTKSSAKNGRRESLEIQMQRRQELAQPLTSNFTTNSAQKLLSKLMTQNQPPVKSPKNEKNQKISKALNMNVQSIIDEDSDSKSNKTFKNLTFEKRSQLSGKASDQDTLASKNSSKEQPGDQVQQHYKRYEPRAMKMQRMKNQRQQGQFVGKKAPRSPLGQDKLKILKDERSKSRNGMHETGKTTNSQLTINSYFGRNPQSEFHNAAEASQILSRMTSLTQPKESYRKTKKEKNQNLNSQTKRNIQQPVHNRLGSTLLNIMPSDGRWKSKQSSPNTKSYKKGAPDSRSIYTQLNNYLESSQKFSDGGNIEQKFADRVIANVNSNAASVKQPFSEMVSQRIAISPDKSDCNLMILSNGPSSQFATVSGEHEVKSKISNISVKPRGIIPSKPITSNTKVQNQIEKMEQQLSEFQKNFQKKVNKNNDTSIQKTKNKCFETQTASKRSEYIMKQLQNDIRSAKKVEKIEKEDRIETAMHSYHMAQPYYETDPQKSRKFQISANKENRILGKFDLDQSDPYESINSTTPLRASHSIEHSQRLEEKLSSIRKMKSGLKDKCNSLVAMKKRQVVEDQKSHQESCYVSISDFKMQSQLSSMNKNPLLEVTKFNLNQAINHNYFSNANNNTFDYESKSETKANIRQFRMANSSSQKMGFN